MLDFVEIFRNIYREIFLNFHDILTGLKYVTSIVPLIVHLLDYLMSCDARSLLHLTCAPLMQNSSATCTPLTYQN